MPISDNAKIYYEASQNAVAMVALTDSGDQTFFKSADNFWSNKAGFVATVYPDGVVNGLEVTPDTTNDQVDVAAGYVYQAGVKQTIAASAGEAITRPSVSDYKISSLAVNDSQAIVEVEGTEGTSFSSTRGAAGGPPLIPVGYVEICQVRMSSQAAALFVTSEIKQIQGDSQERYDYPLWNVKRINVTNGVLGYAGVEFLSALPAIHTGAVPKKVYAAYYTPDFAEVVDGTDFVPPETTHTTTSVQVYGRTIGGSSETLNQSSFTFYPQDGISDAILREKNQDLLFKFKQNELNDPYLIMQGKFGVSRSFPPGGNVKADCTISAESAAAEVTAV